MTTYREIKAAIRLIVEAVFLLKGGTEGLEEYLVKSIVAVLKNVDFTIKDGPHIRFERREIVVDMSVSCFIENRRDNCFYPKSFDDIRVVVKNLPLARASDSGDAEECTTPRKEAVAI